MQLGCHGEFDVYLLPQRCLLNYVKTHHVNFCFYIISKTLCLSVLFVCNKANKAPTSHHLEHITVLYVLAFLWKTLRETTLDNLLCFFSLPGCAKFMRNCQMWKGCQQLFSYIIEIACPVLLIRHTVMLSLCCSCFCQSDYTVKPDGLVQLKPFEKKR